MARPRGSLSSVLVWENATGSGVHLAMGSGRLPGGSHFGQSNGPGSADPRIMAGVGCPESPSLREDNPRPASPARREPGQGPNQLVLELVRIPPEGIMIV